MAKLVARVLPGTLALLLICIVAPGGAQAQESRVNAAEHEGSFWLGYMTSVAFDPRWALWFDSHYNHETFFVLRTGLTYRFAAGPQVTAGYAHLWLNPGDDSLARDEHRPWLQAVFPARISEDWSYSTRIRYDARFREAVSGGRVAEGWGFMHRLRFQTVLTYWLPSLTIGEPFLQLANEVLFHFGREAGPNLLDQNRVSLFVGLKTGPYIFRLGYMDRFVPGVTGVDPHHQHLVVLWVNHSIDIMEPDHDPIPEGANP